MQTFSIRPGNFHQEAAIPSSKSWMTRLIVLGALVKEKVIIKNYSKSSDSLTMIDNLKSIGLNILIESDELIIIDSIFEAKSAQKEIKTGDGGAPNRFLLALISRLNRELTLIPEKRMKSRPMSELVSILNDLKVNIDHKENNIITLKGPLQKKRIKIDAHLTSQFASALMLSFYEDYKLISIKNISGSITYLDLTKFLIEEFLKGKRVFTVPIDFSSLSYPLALGVTLGEFKSKVHGGLDPYQSDSKILETLINHGADIKIKGAELIARKSKLSPFKLDLSNMIDLAPTFAYLASTIIGKTSELRGLKNLVYKESNRLEEIQNLLRLFKVNFSYNASKDILSITGSEAVQGSVDLNLPHDHRMVMAGAMFQRRNGGGKIAPSEAINKSYKGFFDLFV